MEQLRLERRPEARAFSVETLLQYVRDGKIRIPSFQRPLRWRATHVIDLFDSVYRGFPVGDLLLYKRPAEAALLHFGPVDVNAPAAHDAYFVVDGQQRINALASAMLHPEPRPRGNIYAVWFDLETDKFVCAQSVEPPAHWIPVNTVGDSFALLTWLNEWPFRNQRPDLVQRAIALGKALREYPIPAYIVEGASDGVLRLIFKRVNTSGVRMLESEVFEALYGAGGHRPIASACARVQNETGFGEIASETFLRCLKVIEGLDLRATITEREEDATGAPPEAVQRTEEAVRRVIQLLSEDAGIYHRALLPYILPLFVLARFFHLHPRPDNRTRILLARWVWRGALSGAHTDSSDASVQRLSSLIDHDQAASADRLLRGVSDRFEFPAASTAWYGGSAKTQLSAIALIHLHPRDPETGEAIDIDSIRAILDEGKKSIGDVFLDVKGEKRKGHSTVARRVLVPSRVKLRKLPEAPTEVLESHGLDRAAAEALGRGDLSTFTQRRAPILDRWFQRFFNGRIVRDDADRPSIAELVRRADRPFSTA